VPSKVTNIPEGNLEINSLQDLIEGNKPSEDYSLSLINPINFQLNKFFYKNSIFHKKYLGYLSIKRQHKQDNLVLLIFLIIKVSFSLLAIISLIKLGYSSKVRLTRLREIEESFLYEKYRFNVLTDKFDDLFSSEGELRFMKDQDQIISRDIIRVIWR